MIKPAVLKGTRDFLPEQVAKRKYLFNCIETVFEKYGFRPIETPSMERSETLLGKYGEEGDRLIFKVLNNGDFMKDQESGQSSSTLASKISRRAMRYDLTVPFARFVSQHRNDLQFPFKRYQIQPVWRADRPQKGRYQEFYQCDADVVGSDSLMHEAEFILIFDEVLRKLGLKTITIHLNNRKVLSGIAELAACEDQFSDMAVALDKLDKIGIEKVREEWLSRGISEESVQVLMSFFNAEEMALDKLKVQLSDSEIGMKGIVELEEVVGLVQSVGLQKAELKLDLTLARGLDYYTGAIFEVSTQDHKIGSICGGGRYDDLTGVFGLKGMSGVGISFGADRIYDVIEATQGWPTEVLKGTEYLLINFGEKESTHCFALAKAMRDVGKKVEVYPSSAKLKKQMKYADDLGIPYVLLVGDQEMTTGEYSLKEMKSGEQRKVTREILINS